MNYRHLALAAVLAGAVGPALAQAPDPNLGRNLAATCANCHGTNGVSQGAVAPTKVSVVAIPTLLSAS